MSLKDIDKSNIPRHVAVIMDGNGRWAKKRGLRRENGHREGRKSVRKIVECCVELGINNLTLYAFSTENWNRPKLEVDFLMQLLFLSLKDELKTLNKNNIKFETIGNLSTTSSGVEHIMMEEYELWKHAVNYAYNKYDKH